MFEYVFQFDNLIAPQSSGNKTSDIKMSLWAEMKDVLQSHPIFVKAPQKEDFLINDIGKGIYEGPLSHKKLFALLDSGIKQSNPIMMQIAMMLTPRDYTVIPLSKKLAVVSMSVFYKTLTDSELSMNVELPEECPTVSGVLGFGNRNVIKPPKVKYHPGGGAEYQYEIQQLSIADVSHFNALMIAEANHHVACSDLSNYGKTMEIVSKYTDRDLSFMNASS